MALVPPGRGRRMIHGTNCDIVQRLAMNSWRGAMPFHGGGMEDMRLASLLCTRLCHDLIGAAGAVSNKTKRTRDNNEDATIGRLFGYEASLNRLLPEAVVAGNLVDIDSDTLSDSVGEIKRDESINLGVAAVVTQVLPNGNLVIHGTQEVRVNFEVRELSVDGVIRPEDISTSNTVRHDQIAEARIAYGGRGTISDIQRPRYGQELFDIIYPF